jgi:hypothetical protein
MSDVPEFKAPDIELPEQRHPDRAGRSRRGGGSRRRGRANARGRRSGEAPKAKRRSSETPHAQGGSEAGRVLGESLQAAVLRHTTAAVLSRGRGYAKRRRVSELRIGAGRVRGRVLGSGDRRYHVELITPQPAPAVVNKVRWSCDCPYAAEHRRGTCKHVVAVALVTAERLAGDESSLRRWLGQPSGNAAEAEPAELDALAAKMLAAFTAEPVSVDEVVDRALAIAPPPFELVRPAR